MQWTGSAMLVRMDLNEVFAWFLVVAVLGFIGSVIAQVVLDLFRGRM